jgi:hypothetical protein
VPEYLKLHSPMQFDQEMDEIFSEECENLGVRAWVKNDASKERYDYCSRNILVENIVPGDYNSYRRTGDINGLTRRLAGARGALLLAKNRP